MKSMMEIVKRESEEEFTFAIVTAKVDPWFEGSSLLPLIRRAVTKWGKTDDGKRALENSCNDFNVGDLSLEDLQNSSISDFLAREGVYNLAIETFCESSASDEWTYDTHLFEEG